jgi:hypothetical protein
MAKRRRKRRVRLGGSGGTCRTFKRSATSFESMSRARKITIDRGLTHDEARRQCDRFNDNRTRAQVRKGTKCEFTCG